MNTDTAGQVLHTCIPDEMDALNEAITGAAANLDSAASLDEVYAVVDSMEAWMRQLASRLETINPTLNEAQKQQLLNRLRELEWAAEATRTPVRFRYEEIMGHPLQTDSAS